jgi:hypothetical protein
VTSCNIQATKCNLQVTNCNLQATKCNLQVKNVINKLQKLQQFELGVVNFDSLEPHVAALEGC